MASRSVSPCPLCRAQLLPVFGDGWSCSGCGLLFASPPALRAAAAQHASAALPGEKAPEQPFALQPRGNCPLCREVLVPLEDEPWSMCPSCRVRAVPRVLLSRIAEDPTRANRTPLGVHSDDVRNSAPASRAFRVVAVCLLMAGAVMLFQLPADGMEACDRALADPGMSARSRGIICERWIWRDLWSGILTVASMGLIWSMRGRDDKPHLLAAPRS